MSVFLNATRLLVVFGGGVALAMTAERVRVYLRLRRVLPPAMRPLVGHVTAVSAALMGYVVAGMIQVILRIGKHGIAWYLPVYLALEVVAIIAIGLVTRQERERLESYQRLADEHASASATRLRDVS